MEAGNLSEAISAFEKMGDYESSLEYLSLCKDCEKYNGVWENKSRKYYNKLSKETSVVFSRSEPLLIVVAPQRNGEILYKVAENEATLSGDILSYEVHYEDRTFNLATGVGCREHGMYTIYDTYEKL